MSAKQNTPAEQTTTAVAHPLDLAASAHAPFLYFDEAPVFAESNGVILVSLEARRAYSNGPQLTVDRVLVAHLRMPHEAARSLMTCLSNALEQSARLAAINTGRGAIN